MISIAYFLLLGLLGFESILASPTTLLPLERQKKSLQEDLAFFLPEKSTFRERQSSFIKSAAKPNKRSGISSFFSERQHLIDERELKRKRASGVLKQAHSSIPSQSYAPYQEQWDPWFPALKEQKRFEMDSEREAIDSALKHMAWERLNKRLIKLRGLQGPLLDRGERRIRIKKRAPKSSEDKRELEAILSDDVGEEKKDTKQDPTTVVNGTENASKKISKEKENSNFQKLGPKGKQWMPMDSEPTLRSKKSWDDYFGMDKRSSRALPSRSREMDDEDENQDESEQELKDYLVQWYFNKILKHLSPSEELTKDDEIKKKKSVKIIEKDMQIKDENGDDNDDNIDLSDGIPFEEVDERLRKIENAILSEATGLIENGMNVNEKKGVEGDNAAAMKEAENDVIDHLKAAFSLEKMRDALEEFQESFKKIKMQEGTRYRAVGKFEDEKKKKRKKSEAEFDDEDDEKDDKKKKKSVSKKNINNRQNAQSDGEKSWPKTIDSKSDLTNEVASPVFAPERHDEHYLPCPVMTGALGYCEELSDALGEMGQRLARPCVEHMLCYTCDETPSSCDMAFLQDAAELCEDDFRCQAIAGAMRSVFLSNHDEFRFQHEALCDVDQCLLQLQLQQSN